MFILNETRTPWKDNSLFFAMKCLKGEGSSDALFQSLLKYSVVKFSTCRKFSGMDFLLVTIPPIGFMGSTAAVNTAARIRKIGCKAALGVEGSGRS